MARRAHHKCLAIDERTQTYADGGSLVYKIPLCDKRETTLHTTTDERDRVSCPKCLEIMAKQELKTLPDAWRLGDLNLSADSYHYRSEWHLLRPDGEIMGTIRLPNGWGKSWEFCRPYYRSTGELVFGEISKMSAPTKHTALLKAFNTPDVFSTIADAKTEREEMDARMKRGAERMAAQDRENAERKSDTLEGLRSLLASPGMLGNFQTAALHNAIKMIEGDD